MQIALSQIVRSRPLQHIVFWALSYYVLLTIFTINPPTGLIDHIYTILFHFSILLAVYVNLLLLIPRLLQKKRYAVYALALVFVWLAAGLLNEFTFHVMADRVFPGYYFISYYSYYDILRFIGVYLVISTLLKFSRAWFEVREKEARMASLEKERIEMELKMLKSQVHPHFLFNTLNNIYGMIMEEDKHAAGSVVKLSDILRYILYESNQPTIELQKELRILEDYIDLMKIRSDTLMNVTIDIEKGAETTRIPPLLLLPLVENCFKHGDFSNARSNFIQLKVEKTKRNLKVILSNSVKENAQPSINEGIGLQNVKRRLDLIYSGKYNFNSSSDGGIFMVTIEIDTHHA
jgi:sensor histidine kinase YesM